MNLLDSNSRRFKGHKSGSGSEDAPVKLLEYRARKLSFRSADHPDGRVPAEWQRLRVVWIPVRKDVTFHICKAKKRKVCSEDVPDSPLRFKETVSRLSKEDHDDGSVPAYPQKQWSQQRICGFDNSNSQV